VTQALPALLDELDRHGLRATFFVEAINCELYPDAVREIARRGHEVGHHGWRHEAWATLGPEREEQALSRGRRAFAALGIEVRGFRPPGGELTKRSPALLEQLGFDWCSPAGEEPRFVDGLAYVPFRWELVDAYHLMERFDGASLTPERLTEFMLSQIDELSSEDQATLVLHPFLMLDPAWFSGVKRILERVARSGVNPITAGAVADRLRGVNPRPGTA
jgi:peptidoglycan/xylan/chitin deacetylase (PgdA/CDA1 family)